MSFWNSKEIIEIFSQLHLIYPDFESTAKYLSSFFFGNNEFSTIDFKAYL